MSSAVYLARNFNLRKRGTECNYTECNKLPAKEMVLLEVDLVRSKTKELGTVYFCSNHYTKTSKKIISEMNSLCKTGKIIDKKVFDLGYITY